jgi:cation diffusion facilitator CzcD-associated flavoprotein CzcO
MSALPSHADVVVLGAGPAGLAAAAELKRAGFSVIVLDRADRVGASWARHYDRLHLHTSRGLSGLPGFAIPASMGRWVARDDLLAYLAGYAAFHRLDVRLGVAADRIIRSSRGWQIETSGERIGATIVVVATGYNNTPKLPAWPGLGAYRGRVIHSSEYRNPAALAAGSVLVVGSGNSGAEIAADLAEAGVAVQLAVRTPPNIVRRAVAGIPSQYLVLSIQPLPIAVRDRISAIVQRLSVGDLSRYGLAKPPRGIVTQMVRDDVTPTIDVGLLAALRSGTVEVVASVESFEPDAVILADGTRLTPDAVVVATGYSRGLETLVGGLGSAGGPGVLGPKGRPRINAAEQLPELPGLYFIGYSNPLSGNLRQIAIDAKRIARRARRR